ncbi:MAG: hypothetical protein ABW252_02095 [Polyangiales bacterium]
MITSTIVVRRVPLRLRLIPCLLLGGASFGCTDAESALTTEAQLVLRSEAAPFDDASDADVHEPPTYPWDDGECDDVYELRARSGVDPSKPYLVQPELPVSPQFLFDAPWGDALVTPIAFHPLIDNEEVIRSWYLRDASDSTQLSGWQRERVFSPTPRDDRDDLPRGPRSLRLDVRYQNKASTPATDRSGVAICVKNLDAPSHETLRQRAAPGERIKGGCGTCF